MSDTFDFDREKYCRIYRQGLLNDVVPFWMKHSIDNKKGGYLFCLDKDGSVISTDKPVWIHGRFVWLLSTLYSYVEQKQEWIEAARHGLDFLRKYAFDTDGRMFFTLTRDGKPLRKRRYVFSETFMIMALAAYAKATNDKVVANEALELFKKLITYITTPGLLQPKVNQNTRPSQGMGVFMILINVGQVLREVTDEPIVNEWIDKSIENIERYFLKEEFKAVLEMVGPNGEFYDTFEGRQLNPGHGIEAGWFILNEGIYRKNEHYKQLGLKIIDYMWDWGWDNEYGGIIYFRDARNLPVTEYWSDMKFWWPQNEAIIATLLAYKTTNDEKYAKMHQKIHNWAYKYFPDKEHGEWFGYLHRDGLLMTPLKGNFWKGPFHLPRMQYICWQLLK